ncbi:hypothetical protein [Corynebacterium caspium]|uniref:hypothetical protein n=1 Tax=Corynebacterium caspium TaxID=234828 RepID=UPI00035DC245|nr:hypothetical protein [Corynebacterium caspium]WKD58454.1 hypothetical protein CCASP_00085 [Corynebacterium caspium DSM 44850]
MYTGNNLKDFEIWFRNLCGLLGFSFIYTWILGLFDSDPGFDWDGLKSFFLLGVLLNFLHFAYSRGKIPKKDDNTESQPEDIEEKS